MNITRDVDVLLVEDEPIVSMMVEDELSDSGCNVMLASCVREAFAVLQRRRPAAAILDVNLGDEYAFLSPSACAPNESPSSLRPATAAAPLLDGWPDCIVVQKPFEPGAVIKALAALLDR